MKKVFVFVFLSLVLAVCSETSQTALEKTAAGEPAAMS